MKLNQITTSYRWLLMGLFSLMITLPLQAQEVIVKGSVISATDQMPLPGVNVQVKGTASGTVTNFDGKFTLSTVENNTLVFSYIGYQTIEVDIAGRSIIDIELAEDAEQLDEIVVIGYGEISEREIATAVTKVDGAQLAKQPVARAEQALQGSAPGIVVLQESGSPGAAMTVKVRGSASVNGSTPLYMVDGVQVPNLDFLNSSDIANISVLKDAAAAAIYGARGGNGVVLVTTKSGKRNSDGPQVSVNGYYGVQSLSSKPDLMNTREYIDYYNASADWENQNNGGAFTKYSDSDVSKMADTDWYDVVFDEAAVQNYHASVADGGEDYSYALSAGLFSQDGIADAGLGKSNFERQSIRGSFEKDLWEGFNISINGTYAKTDRNYLDENNGGTGSSLMNYINNMPSIFPVYLKNEDTGLNEIYNPGIQPNHFSNYKPCIGT